MASGSCDPRGCDQFLSGGFARRKAEHYRRRGLDRTQDIAMDAGGVEPADVVVLHRVVCCYPDYERLLTAAADHARRLLVLSYPSYNAVARLAIAAENLTIRLRRMQFRAFAHPPARMLAVLNDRGLQPTLVHRRVAWQVAGLER